MSEVARNLDPSGLPDQPDGSIPAPDGADARSHRPSLRVVSPLRPERAGRGVFALVVTGVLVVGMVVILVINTSLAQGAFTISELQAQRAELSRQEQTLAEAVAAAAAPEVLEDRARAMGMVPSETPVFLRVPSGRVLGKPKPAGGVTASVPRLLTPADATASEAVDNASVGTDLPVAPGEGYDPAAMDAAAAQAMAANEAANVETAAVPVTAAKKGGDAKKGDPAKQGAAKKGDGRKPKNPNAENNLWQDSTVLDMTGQLSSDDAGLVAVPVP